MLGRLPSQPADRVTLDVTTLGCYSTTVIRTFGDRRTKAVFEDVPVKGLGYDVRRGARRKLLMLDRAGALVDMRVPPGNRLEALRGDRAGQHSIRINDQWRVCFVWRDGDAYDVEITDYH
jgi:proteic killer suppression protein